jgi:CubicO group peptidase (beta-lactamase class C family)
MHLACPYRPPCRRSALALILSWVCAAQTIPASGQTANALQDDRKAGRSHADATSLTAQTDRLFAAWDKPGSPGGALAVVQDGKVVHQRGFGMANLEYGIPITPATIFDVASVSKQFTAFAVRLLVQEHRLSLDDDVRKYLPELRDFGKTITIRHLLHHTSGLRDQWNLLFLAGWRNQDVITEQDVLNLVWRQEELNFEPGAEHLYSNTGYTLLGLIVKRISGRSLDAFCQERMFKPLGMKDTHFHDDNRTIVPGRSYSYSPKPGGGFAHSPLQYATVGASSLFTTVQDLAEWDRNFGDARVGGREVVARMLEKGKLKSGEELNYACGLELGEYRGLKTVTHNGRSAGYRCSIVRFPEQRLTVILLANLSSFNPEAMARKVADLYLSDKLKPLVPAAGRKPDSRTEVKVDPKVYDAYAGDYQTSEGRVVTFSTENGRLMLAEGRRERIRLLPSSETDFFLRDLSVELSFVKAKDGTVERVILRRDGRELAARRVRREPLTPARLAGYAGDYYSRELGVIYTVATRDGKLWICHPRGEAPTEEIGNDAFSVDFPIGTVTFTRNSHQDINAMLVSTNGPVRNLRFARAQIKTMP